MASTFKRLSVQDFQNVDEEEENLSVHESSVDSDTDDAVEIYKHLLQDEVIHTLTPFINDEMKMKKQLYDLLFLEEEIRDNEIAKIVSFHKFKFFVKHIN